jgi:glycosyltransferase involved in cell wall biosynthesis
LAECSAEIARILRLSKLELDMDDLESETQTSLARLYAQNGHWMTAFGTRQTADRYRRAEETWLPTFSKVSVCSSEDRERLRSRFPGLDIDVFPNRLWRAMIPAPAPVPAPVPPPVLRALFVGALGYWPNWDAAQRFAQSVLPLLRRLDSRWTFAVAGRGLPLRLERLLKAIPGIEILGELDDLAPAYAHATIVVAPLRAGGGTSLKVLEALAHGRPLVATAIAVRGLALQDGRDFLAAETDDDFVRQCVRLAADPGLASRVVAFGYQTVQDRYGYDGPRAA